MTFMPKAMARRATSPPMRPMPTMPSVFPFSSVPSNDLRSHLPATIEACACGILRASASSSEKVSSAVEIVFPPRRVHDHDAPLGRRLDVHVVDADPGPADHLQPRRRGQRLCRHLGRAPDDQRVQVADLGDQLVLLETSACLNLEMGALRENSDALG